MYTKTFKYTDYDGEEREEEFRFSLDKAEIMMLQVHFPEGLEKHLKNLQAAKDAEGILQFMIKIILESCGRKSTDGRRFIKDGGNVGVEFSETPAFSEMLIEFLDPDDQGKKFNDFMYQIVPHGTAKT